MAKSVAAPAQKTKETPVGRLWNYLLEVKNELSKVTWPSREDLKAHTTVVLIFLALLAALVGAMDVAFQRLVLALFNIT